MNQPSNAVDDTPIVSPDRVREKVQSMLRAAQAAGWTDASLSEASGVNAKSIKGYRLDNKEPSLSRALSLAVVLGPRALNPLLALIGYVARPLDEPDALDLAKVVSDGLADLSIIATAAADGRIDHLEEPDTTAAADHLIATMIPLSSAGRAA